MVMNTPGDESPFSIRWLKPSSNNSLLTAVFQLYLLQGVKIRLFKVIHVDDCTFDALASLDDALDFGYEDHGHWNLVPWFAAISVS